MIGSMNTSLCSLPGTFWGITTFFNPEGYQSKYENFKIFRDALRAQGLPLLVVELATFPRKFELTNDDAEILIQVTSRSVLWQKERLLNLALAKLPQNCDKIAWLDSDILFQNSNWVAQCKRLLEIYKIIQPFSESIRLPKNYPLENLAEAFSCVDLLPRVSLAVSTILGIEEKGHPGYAWAARREVIQELGFFDPMIMGGADRVMALTFFGLPDTQELEETNLKGNYSPEYLELLRVWKNRATKLIQQSVSFVPGFVFHLYHGDRKSRNYIKRHELLREYQFNPKQNLRLNDEGVWEWALDSTQLAAEVSQYFRDRREDE